MFKKLTSILFFAPLLAFGQNLGLGDFHQGGFVFYIDSLGKGLLLDVDYLEATYPWDTQNNTVSDWGPNLHYCEGTEYEAIGAGNTISMFFQTTIQRGIMQPICAAIQLQVVSKIGFYPQKWSCGNLWLI
tara:strand:- start:665 stop:1054 length:390 start_codon:yes stop_codon:yes gene_type:complete